MVHARRFRFFSVKRFFCSMKNWTLRHFIQRSLTLVILSILTFLSGPLVSGNLFAGQAFAATTSPTSSIHHNTSHSHPQSTLENSLPFGRAISSGVTLSTTTLNTAAGPVLVNTLDIDLTNPHVRLKVVQAHNSLVSSDETVSSMANRTGAMAGINGDYFEVNGPGRPIGMVAINGQLVQSPASYAVLGVTSSGKLTIGNESFFGSVTNGRASYPLNSVNIYNEAGKGNLVLLTPQLGTPPRILGNQAVLLQATSAGTFIVRSAAYSTSLSALAGQYALIGSGDAADWLTDHLHKGDHLTLHTNVAPNAHLVQAIGGGPVLIKNGAHYYDPNPPNPKGVTSRNPLTAISVNKDGTHAHLVVFDGRGSGPTRSVGLTYAQAASYLLTQGAYSAMLFDTGGSTDMVARFPGQNYASVVNWPSDGYERPVGNGLFVAYA
jgi:exopolysaccharide biosynthesis protein